jgi:hypothetical protein
MKLIRIGLVAAAVAALAGHAFAAEATKIDPAKHAQGLKEAPAVVEQLGLNCDVADALFLGNSTDKFNGKEVKSSVYEVACRNGLGYLLSSKPPAPTDFYDCLTIRTAADRQKGKSSSPPPVCTLPANADPKQGLQPLLTKAGVTCTLKDARVLGASPSMKVTIFEASCNEGHGYIMTVPNPGSTRKLAANDCAEASLFGAKCQLTTDAQITQGIIEMSKAANQPACQANNARWVVSTQSGDTYYEVACADGKSGYIFQADSRGAIKNVITCGKAQQIAGGCTLTSADVAKTQEAGLYTQLAKQSGYPCTVTKYQTLGSEAAATKREVVEMACAERPGSVWALLPTGSGGQTAVYNCLRAKTISAGSFNCQLGPIADTYAALGAQIKAKGKSCDVTNARVIEGVRTEAGDDFIEVACGGGEGMVIAYTSAPIETVKDVYSCKEAAGTTRACKLS